MSHRYPDDEAHALRSRLAALHRVEVAELCLGHGSNELIDLSVRAFATSSEHAVIGVPSFSCYGLSLHAANIPTSAVPMRDGLFWDLGRVQEAVRPETKLVYLDNPGNPTSTHIAAPALRTFLRELPAGVIAVVDEAYFEFGTAADYESALHMRDLRERLLVLRTFSKAYGLAGLRLGYAIGKPELISYLQRVRVPFNASSLAQAAALAALDDQSHIERAVSNNAAQAQILGVGLSELGYRVVPTSANFLYCDVGEEASSFAGRLRGEGISIRPLGVWGAPNCVRVSIGTAEQNRILLESVQRIAEGRPRPPVAGHSDR
jgi:histidinol-phosphate aminotransferase